MIVAGTGHRPSKLGGYSQDAWLKVYRFAHSFLQREKELITEVISGGAQGWDMALALGAKMNQIKYTLAVPFLGQEKMWPKTGYYSQEVYNSLKESAHKIEIVCEGDYASWKMQKRNEFMVDRADIILALWDGSSGGTFNCIEYAKKQRKKVINLWHEFSSKTGR